MRAISGAPVDGMGAFDQIFLDLMDTYAVPGLALAVARNGAKVITRGYGLLDRDDPTSQVSASSSFRIASMSKPITAMALIRLLGQRVFTLDTAIFPLLSPSFPPLPGQVAAAGVTDITIRHLLQHTAGWSKDVYDPMFDVVNIARAASNAWPPPANQPQIIQWNWAQQLINPPGVKYAYADVHYCLLGRVIEHFAGSYADYVSESILQPFGMQNTYLATHQVADRRANEAKYFHYPGQPAVASVYAQGERVEIPYGGFDIENMDSHGGWVSSPVDLLGFMIGVFEGTLIDSSIIAAPANVAPGSSYGLGWQIDHANGGLTYSHNGSLPIPTKAPVCNGIMPPGDSGIMAPPCNGMIPPGRRVR